MSTARGLDTYLYLLGLEEDLLGGGRGATGHLPTDTGFGQVGRPLPCNGIYSPRVLLLATVKWLSTYSRLLLRLAYVNQSVNLANFRRFVLPLMMSKLQLPSSFNMVFLTIVFFTS